MILVHRMIAAASTRPPKEQVALSVERRQFLKRRWRGVAEDGTELGFDLEDRLHPGCVVFADTQRDIVIEQIPETVLELSMASPESGTLIGWKLGNLHQPVEILPGVVRVVDDPAVRRLLEQEAVAFREVTVVFQPLRAIAHAP